MLRGKFYQIASVSFLVIFLSFFTNTFAVHERCSSTAENQEAIEQEQDKIEHERYLQGILGLCGIMFLNFDHSSFTQLDGRYRNGVSSIIDVPEGELSFFVTNTSDNQALGYTVYRICDSFNRKTKAVASGEVLWDQLYGNTIKIEKDGKYFIHIRCKEGKNECSGSGGIGYYDYAEGAEKKQERFKKKIEVLRDLGVESLYDLF